MVNLVTNRVCRILGKVENTERFLGLALYQGIPGTGGRSKRMGAGISPAESDPMLVACAYNRQRLYLFSRREPPDTDEVATGRCCTGSEALNPVQSRCCCVLRCLRALCHWHCSIAACSRDTALASVPLRYWSRLGELTFCCMDMCNDKPP